MCFIHTKADSPEVLKEKKRPRIVDYTSSPAEDKDQGVPTTSSMQDDSREDDGYINDPPISSMRRAPPPPPLRIKKRPIPAGWIRDKNSAAFIPPPAFFPAPPYAAQPKENSNQSASAMAPKSGRPAMMKATQRTHHRTQSLGASLSQPGKNSFVEQLLSAPPLTQITHSMNERSSPQSAARTLLAPPGMLCAFSIKSYLPSLALVTDSQLKAGSSRRRSDGHRRGSSTTGKVISFQEEVPKVY